MGQEIAKKNETLKLAGENLGKLLQSNAEAMPKGFNETRFLQNCLTVLNDTRDIDKCNPVSIARTMIKGAYLGLDFFNKECYAIPYGGQLQFQTDYKGEIKLSKKYSINPIREIYAKIVKEGDKLNISIKDGKQYLDFEPNSISDEKVIAAFAVVLFEDETMAYDVMTVKEIEHTRKSFSKCPNSPAWAKSPQEMYKKTVLRRLCKLIELDFDSQDQTKAFNDGGDLDLNKSNEAIDIKVKDPFKGDISDDNKKALPEPENGEIVENHTEKLPKVDPEKPMSEEEIKKQWDES